jgi:hypothetical protein
LHNLFNIAIIANNESLGIVIDPITVGVPAIFGRAAINTAAERVRREKRVRKARGASGANCSPFDDFDEIELALLIRTPC